MTSDHALPDVIAYIIDKADESDLDTLTLSIRRRRDALRAVAAAAVTVGASVTIRDVSPKYLNGLTGTVTNIETRARKQIASVELDRESTRRLALSSTKYAYLIDHRSYELSGVPLACCDVS